MGWDDGSWDDIDGAQARADAKDAERHKQQLERFERWRQGLPRVPGVTEPAHEPLGATETARGTAAATPTPPAGPSAWAWSEEEGRHVQVPVPVPETPPKIDDVTAIRLYARLTLEMLGEDPDDD